MFYLRNLDDESLFFAGIDHDTGLPEWDFLHRACSFEDFQLAMLFAHKIEGDVVEIESGMHSVFDYH